MAEAARELRRNLKVLFVTGYAENAVLDIGTPDDSVQILTKPFSVEALGAKVAQLLRRFPAALN